MVYVSRITNLADNPALYRSDTTRLWVQVEREHTRHPQL